MAGEAYRFTPESLGGVVAVSTQDQLFSRGMVPVSVSTGTTFPQSDDEFVNDVPVMIWTQNELANVVDNQPCDDPGGESIKRRVTFLHGEPTDDEREDLPPARSEEVSPETCGRDFLTNPTR